MLSPSTRQTASSPMWSSPIRNAWARPSGLGCTAWVMLTPNWEPSPSSRWKPGASWGVVMTRMSRMPARISIDSG
ncbi:hypothetical protein ASG49_09930 [Marmoricola sp. Leaf446]|nr:hypothetical protein ASG49_09930 [Marmoricola sp. Leaf446]